MEDRDPTSLAYCYGQRHRELVYRNLCLGEFYLPMAPGGDWYAGELDAALTFHKSYKRLCFQEALKSIACRFEQRHRELVYRNLCLGEFYVPMAPDGGRYLRDMHAAVIFHKSYLSLVGRGHP